VRKGKVVAPGNDYKIRCPRLGHQIYFSYCRSEDKGLPCPKILECWHDHFRVEDFLKNELTHEDWQKVFSRTPKPKIISLVELIEHAKKGPPRF
jgi:hypothetical protein